MPKGYVVVNVRIVAPESYPEYARRAHETVAQYGGRYLVRGATPEIVEGKPRIDRFVILEFPTLAAAKTWYASDEYRAVITLRERAAESELFFIEGYAAPEAR